MSGRLNRRSSNSRSDRAKERAAKAKSDADEQKRRDETDEKEEEKRKRKKESLKRIIKKGMKKKSIKKSKNERKVEKDGKEGDPSDGEVGSDQQKEDDAESNADDAMDIDDESADAEGLSDSDAASGRSAAAKSSRSSKETRLDFMDLQKIAKSLPQWDKQSVAHKFIRNVELELDGSGYPEREWIRLLPYLFDKKLLEKREWINKHIVHKTKSWKRAGELFIKHFQKEDYRLNIEFKYKHVNQGTRTVQDYSEYFTSLREQLGYKDDDPLVIGHFRDHLHPEMLGSYLRYKRDNREKLEDEGKLVNDEMGSLQALVDKCKELEVDETNLRRTMKEAYSRSKSHHAYPSNQSHTHRDRDDRGYSGNQQQKNFPTKRNRDDTNNRNPWSGDAKKKFDRSSNLNGKRKWQEDRFGDSNKRFKSNHNDYRTNNNNNNNRFNSNSKNRFDNNGYRFNNNNNNNHRSGNDNKSSQSNNNNNRNVTCYACGQVGHYKTDPKCPQYGKSGTNGSNNNNNANVNNRNSGSGSNNSANHKVIRSIVAATVIKEFAKQKKAAAAAAEANEQKNAAVEANEQKNSGGRAIRGLSVVKQRPTAEQYMDVEDDA